MHTLGTAAKATGVSKPTIQRAIKSGRISAKKNDLGVWQIDPAELHRVYPPVTNNGNEQRHVRQSETGHETGSDTRVLQVKIEALEQQLQREREYLADKDKIINDLRMRLDQERDESKKLTTLLLTHRKPKKKTVLDRGRELFFGSKRPAA